jgi:hypothetical protein
VTDLKLVTTAEDTTPGCPCATEPCIVTGPNDPCSVNVQLGDTDDDGDTDDTVYVTFNFHDGRTIEITLDHHRADNIGGLLKKAHAMVEERKDAEMAAHVATWPAPCPLHHGPSIEGTHCTCDGITDAHGNPIKTAE